MVLIVDLIGKMSNKTKTKADGVGAKSQKATRSSQSQETQDNGQAQAHKQYFKPTSGFSPLYGFRPPPNLRHSAAQAGDQLFSVISE